MSLSGFLNLWIGNLRSSVYALLLYALLAILVFYAVPEKARTAVLLAESILFYALCDVRFLLLVLIETAGTWILGFAIQRERQRDNRAAENGFLICGIVLTVSILAFFKYEGFFATLFNPGATVDQLVMPLGISYYTFREISYLADIRMGKRTAETSLLYYASYILFFPHMISGPIARSEGMLERMHEGLRFDRNLAGEGILLVLSGMFKKVVIADRCSDYVSAVFQDHTAYPSAALWLAFFLNSVYIYCDFAGYSEIAVGITKILCIPCERNFNLPYLSQNMKEFWRRWHISLSFWLRDYIYIPLGGSRVSRIRTKINVMIVFVVCGLWHGSGLTYLLWGIYHGVCNILTPGKKKNQKTVTTRTGIRAFLCSAGVFLIASFGWLLFRSSSLQMAGDYFIHLFRGFSITIPAMTQTILPFTGDNSCVAYFLTLIVMLILLFVMEWDQMYHAERWERVKIFRSGLMLTLILLFGVAGSGSFLYANY